VRERRKKEIRGSIFGGRGGDTALPLGRNFASQPNIRVNNFFISFRKNSTVSVLHDQRTKDNWILRMKLLVRKRNNVIDQEVK